MKKNLFTLLFIALLTSCTDNEMIVTKTNDGSAASTRSAGDGKYDVLGYGYDCFYSDFRDPRYSKARVLDLNRLESGIGRDQTTGKEVVFEPSEINIAILHGQTESKVAYGTSIEKMTQSIDINAKTSISTSILKLFSLDLEATIKSNGTSYGQDAFYKIDALKMTRKLTLPYTTPSRLKYFLSNEFLSDIKMLSGKELVDKYGSHVMTDILLGGNFSAFYTGKYNSIDQSMEAEFKAEANFLLSSVKAGVKYSNSLFKSFKNVNIYIKTQGGTQAITSIISQNTNGQLDNVSFDYTGWMNSVTVNSESLIGIGNPDTEMYLLSDFIDDPTKKKEVEFALLLKNHLNRIIYSMNTNLKDFPTAFLAIKDNYNIFFYPPLAQFIPRAEVEIIQGNGYYNIKLKINNRYLDKNGLYSTRSNNEDQQWILHFITEDYSKFMLQNVATGLYLSSYDLSFHDKPSKENEDKFYWNMR